MYKNLHYKIILIFVIFTITLMTAIGAILIGSAYDFYNNDFIDEMESALDPEGTLYGELLSAFGEGEWYRLQREILSSYSSTLGISKYRNYFILDENGNFLDGSDARLGEQLEADGQHHFRHGGEYRLRKTALDGLHRLCGPDFRRGKRLYHLYPGFPGGGRAPLP